MRRGGRERVLADHIHGALLRNDGPILLCAPSYESAERVLRMVPVIYRFRVHVHVPDSGNKRFMACEYDDILADDGVRMTRDEHELIATRLRKKRTPPETPTDCEGGL